MPESMPTNGRTRKAVYKSRSDRPRAQRARPGGQIFTFIEN